MLDWHPLLASSHKQSYLGVIQGVSAGRKGLVGYSYLSWRYIFEELYSDNSDIMMIVTRVTIVTAREVHAEEFGN
jgi:hypothetical protein